MDIVSWNINATEKDLIIHDTDAGTINFHAYLESVAWWASIFLESMCLLNIVEFVLF